MVWFIILGVLFVVAVVVVVSATMGKSGEAGESDPSAALRKEPHVLYRVPDGQDPAVVLAHLREAGWTALPDRVGFEQLVVIGLREDTAEAREEVRRVIAGARATNIEGPPAVDPTPVRFEGETGAG